MAVVYVVVGLVVVEAANNLLPALNVPDWTVTLVVVLTILGLPIALVLAWALELTPEGIRVTPPAGRPTVLAPATKRLSALLHRRGRSLPRSRCSRSPT